MSIPEINIALQRLHAVRTVMRNRHIDALIVPSSDPHLSEYLPKRWQGRQWLSGFTGSAGTLVVTDDFAGVWTDARYWEQAEMQLKNSTIDVMRVPQSGGGTYIDWLSQTMKSGQTVAVDGTVLSLATALQLQTALLTRGVALNTGDDSLLCAWSERPMTPGVPVFEHGAPYAAQTRHEKLLEMRAAMRKAGATSHIMSTLDDIAYLFNLRGADVAYNPVFLAHALIDDQRTTLFIDEHKVPLTLRVDLEQDDVHLAPYDDFMPTLARLDPLEVMLLDPRRVTFGTRQALPAAVRVIEAINPATLAKAVKAPSELDHVRITMMEDGAALCEFFAWLDEAIAARHGAAYSASEPPIARLSELDIDVKLTAARARRRTFVGRSFATIAGFNANGASMHYQATPASYSDIVGDGLLLIDSGGQYLGGTTDITRMVPVGQISAAQRYDCTLVVKAMISLSAAQFPAGIKSPMLDALARAPLWAAGVDFGHGTGHGVGFFLNVHEGPQSIGPVTTLDPHSAMLEGMITSIEPGIYRPGQWGVRIENLVVNQMVGSTTFGTFMRFETLTLCPIDTRCFDITLLSESDRDWLNDYHAMVKARLSPLLTGAGLSWMLARTQPI